MNFVMNEPEMQALFKQDSSTRADGGFQSLLVGLQDNCNRKTGGINVTPDQGRRIQMYAFKYGNGGWENRLVAAFGRHLGPSLDQHNGT